MIAYTLCVWVHIIAAAAWVGSMIFFAVVVVPVLRRPETRSAAPAMLRALGARFRALGWAALAVLVATGIVQVVVFRGIGWAEFTSEAFRASGFGRALYHKLGLVAAVLVVSVAHDALSGKRALAVLEREPGSAKARRTRLVASWIGRVTLLLSLAVLYFAVVLVRGMP